MIRLGGIAGAAVGLALGGDRPLMRTIAGGLAGAAGGGIAHTFLSRPAKASITATALEEAHRAGMRIDTGELGRLLDGLDLGQLALLDSYLRARAAHDRPRLEAILPEWEARMGNALGDPGWKAFKGIIY